MPLANGAIFAGYRILGLLGAEAWVRCIWPNTRDCPAGTP